MAVGKNGKRKRKGKPDESGAAFSSAREDAALLAVPA